MRTQFSIVRAGSACPLFAKLAAFALALTFTLSCSNGDDDGGGGNDNNGSGQGGLFNENPQVYYKNGSLYKGNAVVKITLDWEYDAYNHTDNPIGINAGSITNGIVNMDIMSRIQISEKYLCSPEDTEDKNCLYLFRNYEYSPDIEQEMAEKEGEGCNVSPKDIKIFDTAEFLLYDSDEKRIGTLVDGHYHDDDGNEYFSAYLYSTKAAKITCDNKYKKFDIDAKVGWNKIYIKDPDSDFCYDSHGYYVPDGKEICKAIVSTNNFFTKEAKWTIIHVWDDEE